ncbi:MAG: VOC family protein [Xanthomonadales bacterium]|nr:VOC family protein [Xanthomonadales bacterium]MCB1611921.1 VOC family protein [Xanthomonadales bacterium]
MHRSRLCGFIIDCRTDDLPAATQFWSGALGMRVLGEDGPSYQVLDASARDLSVEVQQVEHESRVHLDIEADDIEAEVLRLERLGARRVHRGRRWWVMQAPSGQRFCVVEARADLAQLPGVNVWGEP